MPPPPPPSKSYLLVVDTDSEDEDEYRVHQRPVLVTPTETPTIPTGPSVEKTSAGSRRPHLIEDEEEEEMIEEKKLTKSQKRNRRKRKNKKSKSNASATPAADAAVEVKKLTVSFSTVSTRKYARCFSGDAVPADGGWPLGMELDNYENGEELEVEDYEAKKQEELNERWQNVLESKKCDEKIIANMVKRPSGTPLVFETRQWDYRSKLKNPLFGILSEEQRQELFLEESTNQDSEDANIPPSSPPSQRRTRSDSFGSHPPPSPSKHSSKGRSRSNSFGSHPPPSPSKHSSKGRSRSNSFGSHPPPSPKHSSKRRSRSNSETFNEKYNQVYVHHVRNSLEQLRNERTKSGAIGCNCRKLTVYLPPKDGSGGKRAQHRRLKPSKLTQELKKRGLYDPSLSREESELILHKAVEEEPCCRGDDCFCARNGIDCQADACSCWHDSHVHAKPSRSGTLTIQDIKHRCGNPLGMVTVDLAEIDSFRSKILQSYSCLPCGGDTPLTV